MRKIFILICILLIFIIICSSCDVFNKVDSSEWGEEEEDQDRMFFYVTGSTDKSGSGDFFTIKFNSHGRILWTKTIKLTSNDEGKGIAIDSSGNVCTSATLFIADPDIYIYKYYPNGSMFWTTPNDYDNGGSDFAERVVVDIYDNIYVTGRDSNIGEIVICKSSSDGVTFLTNTDSLGEHGYGICTDNNGYVYVAGYYDNGSNLDFYISKYDPGTLISIGNTTMDIIGSDVAYGIAIDNSNNLYVTGEVNNEYIYTLKYDTNLNQILSQSWPVTEDYGAGSDRPEDIAVDNNGNVYITGSTSINNYDIFIIKYNSIGIKLWERFFGTVSGIDMGYGIAVDENGNVYITGTTNSFSADYDIIILKYNTNGNQVWADPIIYNNGGNEGAKDIAITYE